MQRDNSTLFPPKIEIGWSDKNKEFLHQHFDIAMLSKEPHKRFRNELSKETIPTANRPTQFEQWLLRPGLCLLSIDVHSIAGTNSDEIESRTSQFYHIEAFLDALTNANEDGRILVVKDGNMTAHLRLHSLNQSVLDRAKQRFRIEKLLGVMVVLIFEFHSLILYLK